MLMSRVLWRPVRGAENIVPYLRTHLSRDRAQYCATMRTLNPTLGIHMSRYMANPSNPVTGKLNPSKNALNSPQLRHHSTSTSNPNVTNPVLPFKLERQRHGRTYWNSLEREFYSTSRDLTTNCSDGKQPPEKSDHKQKQQGGAVKAEMAKCKGSGAESTGKEKPGCKDANAKESGTKGATPCGETKGTSATSSSSGELISKFGERQTLQNFHTDCIAKINAQINSELTSAYVYLSMASFLRQDNVALLGFAKYFSQAFTEEIEHAEKFIQYLSTRGGQLQLSVIAAPAKHEWESIEQILADALSMEKHLNQELLALHACASSQGDAHLSDFLDANYLQEQVQAIKQLADLITIVKRLGCACVYILDRDMMNGVYSSHGK